MFVCFLIVFGDEKIAFKSTLDLYFYPSFEFRIEEKVYTRAVPRDAVGRVFLFSLERLEGGQQEPIVSSKAVPEDLNMKFRSKFNYCFINRGYFHYAILKACKGRDMQFFLQNVQNEIFKILEMFKYNMKFTRAAC